MGSYFYLACFPIHIHYMDRHFESQLLSSEKNLRSTWFAAWCTFTGLLAAEPVPIEICRRMKRAEPVVVASAHSAQHIYPLISFHTVICLDVECLLCMYHLEHLYE